MCSTAEKPATDDQPLPLSPAATESSPYMAPRRRKGTLLPQISQFALEGYSCREISARLRVAKTTVNRWLQELRVERHSNLADATGMIANAVARYDSIYREAMEAWRNSKADKEVRVVEDTEGVGNGGGAKKKKSVRTERRAGDIAFLAQAHEAADAICKLVNLKGRPFIWDSLREEDIHNMSEDELCQVTDVLEHDVAVLEEEGEQFEEATKLSNEGLNFPSRPSTASQKEG